MKVDKSSRRLTQELSNDLAKQATTPRPRRIALLMGQDAGFHRQVLLGIQAYAGRNKRWLFHNAPPTQAVIAPLKEWNPHGIIAHLDDAKVAREILKLGRPVVDTACMLDGLPALPPANIAAGTSPPEAMASVNSPALSLPTNTARKRSRFSACGNKPKCNRGGGLRSNGSDRG